MTSEEPWYAATIKAFAGMKISKKEGLPGRHKDSQVSNAIARLLYEM